MEDPGARAIEELRRTMPSTPDWTVDEDRGFTWWPALHGQRIWADAPFEDDDLAVSRVHASVDIATDIEDHSAVWQWLAALGPSAIMSCVELEERTGTLRLYSRMEVHREIASWATAVMRFAALTQLRDAVGLGVVYMGAQMDGSLGRGSGTLLEHRHPKLGKREEPDPAYFEADRGPSGDPFSDQPLVWISGELDELVRDINRAYRGAEMAARGGMVVRSRVIYDVDAAADEQAFGNVTFIAGKEHPTRGHGVFVHMNLPVPPVPDLIGVLNRLEALGESGTHVLGSWFPNRLDGQLCFGSFIPNRLLKRGLLFNLLTCNAMRARWARSVIG